MNFGAQCSVRSHHTDPENRFDPVSLFTPGGCTVHGAASAGAAVHGAD